MRTGKLVTASCALVIATLGVFATGCGHVGALREAAAADFNCPKGKVHVLKGGKTRDVNACGQRATYKWEDGEWTRISTDAPAQQGAPGVAPAQAAPVMGTPTQPPPSAPAPGSKQL